VNRTDAELGTRWKSQVNISQFISGARACGAWQAASADALPERGHIVVVGDRAKGEEEHLLVALDCTGDVLTSADLGQVNKQTGRQAGRIVTRPVSVRARRLCIGTRHALGWALPELAPRTRRALELPPERPATPLPAAA
jgi:hypothetical protein